MALVLMALKYVLTVMEDELMLKILKKTLPLVDRLLITVACDTSD
jgi:hypothetical protein